MPAYALLAVGADRPGIIASVAERLVAHGVNITDSQMGILRGSFSMALALTVPEEADPGALEADLRDAAERLRLDALVLRPMNDAPVRVDSTHAVTVYGADHPGIVAAVTGALARNSVNVCDLRTRLAGGLYVMHLEVAQPADAGDDERLRESMAAVAGLQDVEITVTAIDADLL
jgi:glycine cleavage system transcriptional repressor